MPKKALYNFWTDLHDSHISLRHVHSNEYQVWTHEPCQRNIFEHIYQTKIMHISSLHNYWRSITNNLEDWQLFLNAQGFGGNLIWIWMNKQTITILLSFLWYIYHFWDWFSRLTDVISNFLNRYGKDKKKYLPPQLRECNNYLSI